MITPHFDRRGEGLQGTLILLHGAGVNRKWFQAHLDILGASFHVLAPDLPGHGSRAQITFEMDRAVEDLSDLVRTEARGSAVLVGTSLGGYLAIAHAARYPQQAAGIVINGASMNLNGLRGLSMRLTGLFLRLRGLDKLNRQVIESYRKRIPAERLDPVLEAGLSMTAAVQSFAETSGRDYHRLLRGYPGPVLILNGENDTPNRKADPDLVRGVPQAELRILKGCGHLCSLEAPEAFSEAVLQFAGRRIGLPVTP